MRDSDRGIAHLLSGRKRCIAWRGVFIPDFFVDDFSNLKQIDFLFRALNCRLMLYSMQNFNMVPRGSEEFLRLERILLGKMIDPSKSIARTCKEHAAMQIRQQVSEANDAALRAVLSTWSKTSQTADRFLCALFYFALNASSSLTMSSSRNRSACDVLARFKFCASGMRGDRLTLPSNHCTR